MTAGTTDNTTPAKARAHVLIVDDDELVRMTAREVFERVGLRVSVATNGIDAISELGKEPADLVILDVLMPEKEGIETLIQIKREYPNAKVMVISSGGRKQIEDFLIIAQRFGADAVLKKPIKPSVLLSHASQLLWGDAALPAEPKWKSVK